MALLLIVAAAGDPQAQGRSGSSGPRRGAHLDRPLAERLARGLDQDEENVRVIIRLKPGAKRGLIQALRAQGATVSADFTVVEAVAANLPVRLVRALQAHDLIEGISTDADVSATGLSTSVSGAALNSVYSLRSTLGLQTTTSTSSTKTFQQGNGYTGAVDTEVRLLYPTTSRGNVATLEVDNDLIPNDGYVWSLVRFDNLFGSGSNQIPVGSTITSATLTLNHYADGDYGASASLHQMLVDWNGSSTWASLLMSGPGVQFDNVEANGTRRRDGEQPRGHERKSIQRSCADGGGPGVGERPTQSRVGNLADLEQWLVLQVF